MLGCYFCPALLLLTVAACLVQSAPSDVAFVGIDRMDRAAFPGQFVSLDYALADKRYLVPELELALLQERFKQDDKSFVQMHLLQLNLLKILLLLDVVIFICIFYLMRSD